MSTPEVPAKEPTLAGSLLWLWCVFGLSAVLAQLVVCGLLVHHVVTVDAASETLSGAMAMERFDAVASSVGETASFLVFNGCVVLLLCLLAQGLRYCDPRRELSESERRWQGRDPLNWLAARLSRTVRAMSLEHRARHVNAWCWLVLLPLLVPIKMGLIVGVLQAILIDLDGWASGTLVGLALLLPHGVFELTGLLLPLARLHRLKRRHGVHGVGSADEAVWADVRERTSWPSWRRMVVVALALIAVAAVIEAHLTPRIGDWVSEALGLPI